MTKSDIIIYINVPFCIQPPTFSHQHLMMGSSEAKAEYLDALKKEIISAADDYADRNVCAVYLGGNPSIMRGDLLGDLMDTVRKYYYLIPHCELSLEVLPNTVCVPSVSSWGRGKPNRVNLHVHSIHPKELQALNCPFTVNDIQNAILLLDKFHVNNINLNLTYGIPGQTQVTWKQTLRSVLDLEPFHITISPLLAAGESIATEEEQFEWYQIACDFLKEKGFHQYSVNQFVVNHAVSQYHVQKYMGCPVVGFGLDSHSACDGYLYTNTSDYENYILHSEEPQKIIMNPRQMDQNYLSDHFLYHRLCLMEGFNEKQYREEFGMDFPASVEEKLSLWQQQGMLERHGENYCLTPLGRFRWQRI